MALTQKDIAAAAFDLLNHVGLDGLTMRALATRLNVQAPTLYWHVPSKQALLDHLANALVARAVSRIKTDDAPLTVLRSVAQELRSALLEKRDGARVFAGTYVIGEHVFKLSDIALEALLKSGVHRQDAVDHMFNLIHYVLGFTIEEQALDNRWIAPDERSAVRKAFADFADERYPTLSLCTKEILEPDFDRRFTLGVNSFLRSVDQRPQGGDISDNA